MHVSLSPLSLLGVLMALFPCVCRVRVRCVQPGMVGGLTTNVAGAAGHVVDTALGKSVGTAVKLAQQTLLGEVPEEATTGSYQEEVGKAQHKAKRGGKRGIGKLAFWQKKGAVATAAEDEEMDAYAEDVQAVALEAKLEEVLMEGLALPPGRKHLQDCYEDEHCDLMEEAKKLDLDLCESM